MNWKDMKLCQYFQYTFGFHFPCCNINQSSTYYSFSSFKNYMQQNYFYIQLKGQWQYALLNCDKNWGAKIVTLNYIISSGYSSYRINGITLRNTRSSKGNYHYLYLFKILALMEKQRMFTNVSFLYHHKTQ